MAKLWFSSYPLVAMGFTLSHVTLSEVGQYIRAVLDFLFSFFQLYLVLMPMDGASVFSSVCLSGRHGQCWCWPYWAHTVASKLPGPFKHSCLGLSVDLDWEKRLEGWLLCCNLPQSPHIWTYKGSNLWSPGLTMWPPWEPLVTDHPASGQVTGQGFTGLCLLPAPRNHTSSQLRFRRYSWTKRT